jgi:hypothetical protein
MVLATVRCLTDNQRREVVWCPSQVHRTRSKSPRIGRASFDHRYSGSPLGPTAWRNSDPDGSGRSWPEVHADESGSSPLAARRPPDAWFVCRTEPREACPAGSQGSHGWARATDPTSPDGCIPPLGSTDSQPRGASKTSRSPQRLPDPTRPNASGPQFQPAFASTDDSAASSHAVGPSTGPACSVSIGGFDRWSIAYQCSSTDSLACRPADRHPRLGSAPAGRHSATDGSAQPAERFAAGSIIFRQCLAHAAAAHPGPPTSGGR